MAVEVDDGVSFDLKGLRIEAIREEVEYGGSRLRTTACTSILPPPDNPTGSKLREATGQHE